VATPDFLDLTIRELAAEVGARTPAPSGGSVAAIVLMLAAGLTEMAARFADGQWSEAAGAAAQAARLRTLAEPLPREDAEAYAAALEALRRPAAGDPAERDRLLGEALSRAADVPLRIAEVAADVAALAADVVEHGNPNLKGDAAAGAIFAEAAARAAAHLVSINLAATRGDDRAARAAALADAAARSVRRSLAAGR
jgi:formiminotetrahydrofolate cyclodeaminase